MSADHYYTADPQSTHKSASVAFSYRGQDLLFQTDSGIFSRTELDSGTRILLNSLPDPLSGSLLDMGCGWGAIGISLGKVYPDLKITMADVNSRACDMSRENAQRNGVQAAVVSSDGYTKLQGCHFDWIVQNPPIRAGKAVMYQMFADAADALQPEGGFYLVIRKQQGAASAEKYLQTLFAEVHIIEKKAGYWIFHCSAPRKKEKTGMNYDACFFDQEMNRRGSNCVKWDMMEAELGHEINPMWVADMDFMAPEEIIRALEERAAHPAYGYTYQSDSAVEAMLSFMQRRHHVILTKDEFTLLPCVISGLRASVLTLTEPGDSVILQPPVYGPFYDSIRENDRKIAECPLFRDDGGYYTMDLGAVEAACANGAKLMFLCNPHNPVGRCWKKEELEALLSLLDRYGVALVSDEIHEDFVYEKDAFVPILRLVSGSDQKIIALTSVSKSFNLAGLQQAVLFTRNPELLKVLQRKMRAVGIEQGNIFALTATEAAYRYGDAWLDGVVAYMKEGEMIFRRILSERLPKAVFSPLEATYLGWLDMRAYGYSSEELRDRCRKAGVEFNVGTIFSKVYGEGFLRVNFACSHRRVKLAAEQLCQAMDQ